MHRPGGQKVWIDHYLASRAQPVLSWRCGLKCIRIKGQCVVSTIRTQCNVHDVSFNARNVTVHLRLANHLSISIKPSNTNQHMLAD